MLSLINSKYATYIFSAVGAVAILLVVRRCMKYYKKYKKEASSLSGLIKSTKIPGVKTSKHKSVYLDVVKKLKKQAKNITLPAFFIASEGDVDNVYKYIRKLINMDEAEVIIIDASQSVIVNESMIVFVVTTEEITLLDMRVMNKMLDRLYRKSYIQAPFFLYRVALEKQTVSPSALIQRIMSEVQIFHKCKCNIDIELLGEIADQDLKQFYKKLHNRTAILVQGDLNSEEIKKLTIDNFNQVRNSLTLEMTKPECDINSISGLIETAGRLEHHVLSSVEYVTELSKSLYLAGNINPIKLNYGLHSDNPYCNYFNSCSLSYNKSIRLPHILLSIFGLLSISVSGVFAYNNYQASKFNYAIKKENPFSGISSYDVESGYNIYKELRNKYREKILIRNIYTSEGSQLLNKQYADFLINDEVLPKLYNSQSIFDKAIYLSVIGAFNSPKLKNKLEENSDIISAVTKLSSEQLKLIYDNNSSKIFNEISISLSMQEGVGLIKTGMMSNKLLDGFIDNRHIHISNDQLRNFISDNVVVNQKLCLLQSSIPLILSESDSLGMNYKRFFINLSGKLPYGEEKCNQSSLLLELQDLIPGKELNVKSFSHVINQMLDYHKKIQQFMNDHGLELARRKQLMHVLMSADLNTNLYEILNKDQSSINLLDPEEYYQYTTHSVFSRNVENISLAYTKNVLENSIIPLVNKYKNLSGILDKEGINHSSLDEFGRDSIKTYADKYIYMMNSALVQTLPKSVNLDNLQMFLIDRTSENTPLSNMLDYVRDNTSFNDAVIKTVPELYEIQLRFSKLNEFISSKDYQTYKNILLTIRNSLSQTNIENYKRLYGQLSSDTPENLISKMDDIINNYGFTDKISYKLFSTPISIIRQSIANFLINNLIDTWDLNITPKVSQVESQFPFDLNSSNVIDSDTLNNSFGIHGVYYNEMYDLLKEFIHLSPLTTQWELNESLSLNQKVSLQPYLTTMNYFFHIQKLLWSDKGKPLDIDLLVQAQPFESNNDSNEKMTLSFLQVGDSKILGLNTLEQSNKSLKYNWQLQPSVSVGWLSNASVSYQLSYQGEWALFKMMADSKCDKSGKCQWLIKGDNPKVSPYIVTFKVKSKLLSLFKHEHKENV
ncbi:hypothetical protein [Dongshaea marina]|uniref:hypothetical protein n=1 Tax=Dongshaea marina TaxID=2047966 RepID=UPI000D3E6A29|nr:hypothetical protein [Dongshaea marina]